MKLFTFVFVATLLELTYGCSRSGGHYAGFSQRSIPGPAKTDNEPGFVTKFIAGIEAQTIETDLAVRDVETKVSGTLKRKASNIKNDIVKEIAGVEAETVDGAILASVTGEKVGHAVHEIKEVGEEVLEAVEYVPSMAERIFHYILRGVEIFLAIVVVMVLLYLAKKFRSYYYLIKGHAKPKIPTPNPATEIELTNVT